MIVSALVKRYEDQSEVPAGWQKREVSYALEIDGQGRLLDVILLEVDEKIGKRTVRRKKPLTLPQEIPRAGLKAYETANFLCDDGNYMLGLNPLKFESARRFHERLLDGVDSPQARAILAYFRAGPPEFPADKLFDKKKAAIIKYVFQFDMRHVDYEVNTVRRAWDVHYSANVGETIRCLVTGEDDVPLSVHGKLHIRGGQPSGSSLISANAESFTSYGKTKDDRAADVGKYAADAYVSALETLLKDQRRSKPIGGDTLLYWAEKGGEAEEGIFADMLAPPKSDDDAELAAVAARIARGGWAEEYRADRMFYLLCLSPNAGRISVRFFHAGIFADIIRNIQSHHSRMEIAPDGRTPFNFIPLWLILAETTVKGSASDANPLLGGQLLGCVLKGGRYPITLYNSILSRVRAGSDISKTKAAVVKAVLIKNYDESEVTTVALNEESNNKAYVLGRLFSVLEQLQDKANGSTNIRSRYFASANANPGSVFPTLLSLSMHHSAKLDNDTFFEKQKGRLLDRLDGVAPFPAALGIDDQGRFIVGYYHQRQWFYTKKDKGGESVNEQ